jgi:hypothetical protein
MECLPFAPAKIFSLHKERKGLYIFSAPLFRFCFAFASFFLPSFFLSGLPLALAFAWLSLGFRLAFRQAKAKRKPSESQAKAKGKPRESQGKAIPFFVGRYLRSQY